jgi:hypothetical protein
MNSDKPSGSTRVRVNHQADVTRHRIDGRTDHPERTSPSRKSDGPPGSNLIGQAFQGRPGREEGQVERPRSDDCYHGQYRQDENQEQSRRYRAPRDAPGRIDRCAQAIPRAEIVGKTMTNHMRPRGTTRKRSGAMHEVAYKELIKIAKP